LVSVFFAPTRHPVMQAPHSVHPVRLGPTPPKNGSGTAFPGWPNSTPTSAGRNVSAQPMRFATVSMSRSAGVMVGFGVTPSIREAWS